MTVLKKATVKSYNAASHEATVQIAGSLAVWLDGVRVATDIPAADVVAGRQCTVLFLDPSNQDEAVVLTIQGANPSVPSGATVAASATVVTETAFGQASAPGAASPYSRGDHTHGTPTDPVPAHAAIIDAHAMLGAANVWAALQTFNAGITLPDNQPATFGTGSDATLLYDGTDLIVDPDVVGAGVFAVAGGFHAREHMAVGPTAVVAANTLINSLETVTGITTDRAGFAMAQSLTPAANDLTFTLYQNASTISNTGFTGTTVVGLSFIPLIIGGTITVDAVRATPAALGNPNLTVHYFHAQAGAMLLGAGSVDCVGLEIGAIGHANFDNVYGIRIAELVAGGTLTRPISQEGVNGHNLFAAESRFSGDVLIGADAAPAASALLELQSTTRALLLTRMTTAQRDALTAVAGMLLYNTTLAKFQGYDGAWVSLMKEGLSAGGELGGTYPDPTINATHSGSAHHAASHTLASHSSRPHSELSDAPADAHHAQDHASRHEPAGADAMTVDAVAATGSLRTLGGGAQQAAAGDHTHAGGGTAESYPGPFSRKDLAQNLTDDTLTHGVDGGTDIKTPFVAPRAGSITALSVASTEARTAGSATFTVFKNGATTGFAAVLDATNTQYVYSTQASGTDTFVAGDRIDIRVTTTGDWSPTSADITADFGVQFD